MKNLKFSVIFALVAMALTTSCTKDQTVFNVNDIPYSAKIVGNVTCDMGELRSGNNIDEVRHLNLFIKIANSEFSSNLTGTSVFTTTTNENGYFEISVPCTMDGVDATITADDFYGAYWTVKNNNESYTNVVYSLKNAMSVKDIVPNSINICNISDFSNTPAPKK